MGARRVVAVGAAIVLSFAAGWTLRAEPGADEAPAAVVGETIDELRRERDDLRTELARARRHRPASPSTPAGEARADTPRSWEHELPPAPPRSGAPPAPGRFVPPAPVPGFEVELTHGDWRTVGALLMHRRDHDRIRREEAAGRELTEEEDDRADWLEEWALDGLDVLPGDLVGVLGDTPDAVLTHPAVTTNLMVVVLDATGHPVSTTTRSQLGEIARRWAERDERRAAHEGARPHASFLRHVMDRVELREAFLDEALSILTPEQQRALRPPEEIPTLGSDFFSAAPLIRPIASSLWGISSEPEPIGVRLYRGNGPYARAETDAVRERLREIAEEWGETLPEDAFPVAPTDRGDALYPTSFARALLETQAALCDRWLREGGLSAAGRESLREERDLYVISPAAWAQR